MGDELQNGQNGTDTTGAGAAGAAAGAGAGGGTSTPPAGSQTPPPQQQQNGREAKVVSVPTAAMARIKAEERQKGKREAMADLEGKFKAAGFSSIDEALSKLAQVSKGGSGNGGNGGQQRNGGARQQGANGQAQQPNGAGGNGQRNDRRDRKSQEQLERERRQRIKAERSAKASQARLDAEQGRMSLERVATKNGIVDPDYAITLLTRHLEGKSEEELRTFDEAAYFNGLRKTHSYLFGETTVPASTGIGGNGSPHAPKPHEVTQQNGQNGALDARTMTQEQYEKHLRSKGLTPPQLG